MQTSLNTLSLFLGVMPHCQPFAAYQSPASGSCELAACLGSVLVADCQDPCPSAFSLDILSMSMGRTPRPLIKEMHQRVINGFEASQRLGAGFGGGFLQLCVRDVVTSNQLW